MNKYAKLLRSNFLILNRDFLKLLNDLNTAVYLSYLIDKYDYFSTNNMITIIDSLEYFFNVQKDIEDEICLTARQQKPCLELLIKLNIVKTKLKGIPAKTFYHIDFDLLVELLTNTNETTYNKSVKQDMTKCNNLQQQNVSYITNTKELKLNTNIKSNKETNNFELVKIENDIDVKQIKHELQLINQNELKVFGEYKEQVTDLLDYKIGELIINNDDLRWDLNKYFQSETYYELEKEQRKLSQMIPAPEVKNKKNLIKYFNDIGKIKVSQFMYLYPSEIIKLRLKYNPKYLSEKISGFDDWCFNDTNFKSVINHYKTICRWIKKEIDINQQKTNNIFDMYYYYNHGVDRDEF